PGRNWADRALAGTIAADLVVWVTAEDLSETQWQWLQRLHQAKARILLVFKNQDRYTLEEQALIVGQLRQRVRALLAPADVVAVTAANALKVRQHQEDGSTQEWLEAQNPEIEALSSRLEWIFANERHKLIWQTVFRQAVQLKTPIKDRLNAARKVRSLAAIEQYQWLAGAAAFANPVASLDLVAAAAINGQMLVDLSAIYQQPFSLSQAQAAAGTLGELMLKLGLVELSTQALGDLLKGHAFTYAAGGLLQGVSAAYLTRLAGLSAIAYFQEQEMGVNCAGSLNLDRFGQKLQEIFAQTNRAAVLRDWVKQTTTRLKSPASAA
ncbi:MAG: DUF697 domain-containing protein, partial [Chloroflexaceae bacterium]|nr:DUF697 domain-containing protein [Chloroflexaceae bacterium]